MCSVHATNGRAAQPPRCDLLAAAYGVPQLEAGEFACSIPTCADHMLFAFVLILLSHRAYGILPETYWYAIGGVNGQG